MRADCTGVLDGLTRMCNPSPVEEDLFSYVSRGIGAFKGRWPYLAKKSDVSYSFISKAGAGLYKDRNIGHRTLERIASALRAEGFQ